jgi:thiamine pyrophosphate-dependent acetolactate synthase large subunit-like protein
VIDGEFLDPLGRIPPEARDRDHDACDRGHLVPSGSLVSSGGSAPNSPIDPVVVAQVVARAVARERDEVGLFAESGSAMFYVSCALCEFGDAPYSRVTTHYGSMGHAIAGALGFCASTGKRAVVLTGDGSFDLITNLQAAVKHGLRLTVVVLNDSSLGLPSLSTGRVDAVHVHAATSKLAHWDYTRQGSPLIGGRRVVDLAELDSAISDALAYDGCYVVDSISNQRSCRQLAPGSTASTRCLL